MGQILKESGFERILILKMDIEGAEAIVFTGDYDDWLSQVDNLVIELHHVSAFGSTLAAFHAALEGRGFEFSHAGELTYCRRVLSPVIAPRHSEAAAGGNQAAELARLRAEGVRLRESLRDLVVAYRAELARTNREPEDGSALDRAERELETREPVPVTRLGEA